MNTTIIIIVTAIIISLLITAREGYQQRDRVEPKQKYSKIWHQLGFFIRFLLTGITFVLTLNWYLTSLMVIIFWPLYNIACNIGAKKKWYYLSDKGIDGMIRKLLPFVKFDK